MVPGASGFLVGIGARVKWCGLNVKIPLDVLMGVAKIHGEINDPGVPISFAVVWDEAAGESMLHCLVDVFPWGVEPLFDGEDVMDVFGEGEDDE